MIARSFPTVTAFFLGSSADDAKPLKATVTAIPIAVLQVRFGWPASAFWMGEAIALSREWTAFRRVPEAFRFPLYNAPSRLT
ncbi:MAG: hypothetical protein AAFX40_06025 [Cyanobacteria bacterium J06639_1]